MCQDSVERFMAALDEGDAQSEAWTGQIPTEGICMLRVTARFHFSPRWVLLNRDLVQLKLHDP